jgi:hypothetical protein
LLFTILHSLPFFFPFIKRYSDRGTIDVDDEDLGGSAASESECVERAEQGSVDGEHLGGGGGTGQVVASKSNAESMKNMF